MALAHSSAVTGVVQSRHNRVPSAVRLEVAGGVEAESLSAGSERRPAWADIAEAAALAVLNKLQLLARCGAALLRRFGRPRPACC